MSKSPKLGQFLSALGLMLPLVLFAARDGEQGKISKGTLNISATIGTYLRLSGARNIAFTPTSLLKTKFHKKPSAQTITLCIYNNSSPNYQISSIGQNSSSSFFLTNGVYNLPYSVAWNPGTGASFTNLTPGAQKLFKGANETDSTCNNHATNNASLKITIPKVDVPAGMYKDILRITVTR